MTCYHPVQMYQDPGKAGLTFKRPPPNSHGSFKTEHFSMPCKRCIGCRLDYSRAWAVRIQLESTMHQDNCFLTLTYNDENLPPTGTLIKEHFQKFIRSLRIRTGQNIRYYMCGEYGDLNKRPHYHAILFGYKFTDQTQHTVINGNKLYTSDFLSKIWTKGFSSITDVTWKSGAYVARYIMKKQYGTEADNHYGLSYDIKTGKKNYRLLPEYCNMSNRPGIGSTFYEKYFSDLFPADSIVLNGKKYPVPKYYRDKLKIDNPEMWEQLKSTRLEKMAEIPTSENTRPRMNTKERVKIHKANRLKRAL